ncbi:MAG: hypothetical protein HY301_14730 [Verrucomicrobia bacterium]|nr:hypothetical protein [Verrucomicrobiota bacterium]
MKHIKQLGTALVVLVAALFALNFVAPAHASGGSGSGGGTSVDTIKVSKCYCNGVQMLIKASSSDPTAHLYAFRPDGTYQGEVQNGGGSRYGGTVMGFVPYDPGYMIIVSSSGGSVVAPTTPFIQ